ncbi:VG15 protein [Streptomyces sp. NPDC000941]
MTPEEYRRAQNTITAALRAVLAPLVATLRGRPTDAQWAAFLDAAYPALYRARVQSWQLAADFYADQRRAQLAPARSGETSRRDVTTASASGGDSSPREETPARDRLAAVDGGRDESEETPEVPRRNYPPRALAAAYRPLRARLDALDEGAPLPDTTAEQAVRVAERHARDAGREAIVDAARHDPRALGYARRALSGHPCAFCLMLVSRGPVYRNASAALRRDGEDEPYHDGCSCVAVPVFNADRWPGRDEAERLEAEWRQSGGTLAEWRRHIDEQRRQQADDSGSTSAAS